MYKVMLVDDEEVIRSGLRLKIDWSAYGFQVADEAGHGKEALRKLERQPVDLVITDVRMPVMNGLEFLQAYAAGQSEPGAQFVILSGYNDFAYAQTALRAGASDYLLKPVVREELIRVLQRTRERLDERARRQELETARRHQAAESRLLLREQLLLRIVKEPGWSRKEISEAAERLDMVGFGADGRGYASFCIEMRLPKARSGEPEGRAEPLKPAFQRMCRELADRQQGMYGFYDPAHPFMMQFVAVADSPAGGCVRTPLLRQWQSELNRCLRIETVIGIGRKVERASELADSYTSSLLSWSKGRLGPHSQILDGCGQERTEADGDEAARTERLLLQALDNRDPAAYSQALDEWLSGSGGTALMFSRTAATLAFKLEAIAHQYDAAGAEIEEAIWKCRGASLQDLRLSETIGLLRKAGLAVIALGGGGRLTGGAQIVELIKRHIDSHYESNLSLSSLADRFHIHPTHLSEIFKKHTGSNFSEYVQGVRMREAAELLKHPHLKLDDICRLIGFSQPSYFSTVFKKYSGQSPNDYRRTLDEPGRRNRRI